MALAIAPTVTRPTLGIRPRRRSLLPLDTTTAAWMSMPSAQRKDLAQRTESWLRSFRVRHPDWQS